MRRHTTSQRLKEIINTRNLKQADILRLCEGKSKRLGVKMNSSDLSQYVSGKVIPGPDKLALLADALNVSETWLLGYDSDEVDLLESEDGQHFMWEYKDAMQNISKDPLAIEVGVLNILLKDSCHKIVDRKEGGSFGISFDSGIVRFDDDKISSIFQSISKITEILAQSYVYNELEKNNNASSSIYIEHPKPKKNIDPEELLKLLEA